VAVLICSCELFGGTLPAQQKKAAAPQGIDALTAPIALYPDALIAQILDASTNPAEVQDFSNWLKQNASLKGSELQEAASKANFDAAFIALSLFPDVIQMMAQKLDWTKQLGEAFKTDDTQQIMAIFGREAFEEVASGDAVSDKQDREVIAVAMEQSWRWVPLGPDRQELIVGEEQWPVPIPLAKSGD